MKKSEWNIVHRELLDVLQRHNASPNAVKTLAYTLLTDIYSAELAQFPEHKKDIQANFNRCHMNSHAMLFNGVKTDDLLPDTWDDDMSI